jgi:hypothetical protein
MTNEIWMPIPNLPPYFASNFGRIAKIRPNKEDLIMWTRVQKGYERLLLTTTCNARKDFLVHRLVAMAFHGLPPEGKKEVNHIDGNKTNNIPENLEWISRSDNLKHYYQSLDGMAKRPRGIKQWQAKFTDDEVRAIKSLSANGKGYKEISEILGKSVTSGNVSCINTGRTYGHIK